MIRCFPPDSVKKLVTHHSDPEDLSAFMSSIAGPVQYERLSASGPFHHRIDVGIIGDVLIWTTRTASGYRAYWKEPPANRFELHYVERGHYHSATVSQNVRAGPGQVYLLHDTREHRVRAHPDTVQTCISIPLSKYAKAAPVAVKEPSIHLAGLSSLLQSIHPAARIVQGIANLLHARDEQDNPFETLPMTAFTLKEALLQVLIHDWPRLPSAAETVHKPMVRDIRRATDWIDSHVSEKISLQDIAVAAGMGHRTLQKLFRREVGMTPIQYVIAVRLSRVHEELTLAGSDRPIASIARAWGFGHMGEFERHYRERFGRTPSETRREARYLASDN